MTPEQARALSDDELNRAMFYLYWVVDEKDEFDKLFNSISPESLNYLTDYNITMPLVIAHEIDMDFDIDNSTWNAFRNGYSESKNYLRAACECLVLIALADK